MKKLIILSFICAAGVIACSKKMMPESDANNPSKPANDKSAKSESQSGNTSNTNTNTNTNTSDNGLPSFGNMQKSTQPGAAEKKAADLIMGKTVYITKCNTCHALKTPSDYTADQIKNILKTEIPRAKLDSKEAEQVTAYLLANTK